MTASHVRIHSSQALVERLFAASVATMDIFGVYLGERLGLYRALAAKPMTVTEFTLAANIDERYAREWLEQQAVSGLLGYELGVFRLEPEYAAVLADRDSADFFAPIARMLVAAAARLPAVTSAYRTGEGISWDAYGRDMVEGQSELNRPFFLHQLGKEILPSIAEVHDRLSAPGARVAEVGFGGGWASIAIANAYPETRVDGFDPDALSVELATANATGAGVSNRVRFLGKDGAEAAAAGDRYDLVCAFECLHDMANPVAVLSAMRRMAAAGGVVLVMDERVPEQFSGEGDDVERFMYGWSVTTCLPNGRTGSPSAATGTVLRQPLLETYALSAGFSQVEALDVENDFFRFYILR